MISFITMYGSLMLLRNMVPNSTITKVEAIIFSCSCSTSRDRKGDAASEEFPHRFHHQDEYSPLTVKIL